MFGVSLYTIQVLLHHMDAVPASEKKNDATLTPAKGKACKINVLNGQLSQSATHRNKV
jgi:hypothetical protein